MRIQQLFQVYGQKLVSVSLLANVVGAPHAGQRLHYRQRLCALFSLDAVQKLNIGAKVAPL